ncbi:MAG: TonB-dependent copper receptor [Rhodocyclaceae bacterium]|nr:TonB-dependent copper receptor [Rhodocyclaceae bacterium]
MNTRHTPLCLLFAAAFPAWAQSSPTLFSEVVVTAPQMRDPLVVVNDPKAPQVPVPANDGASFLKNIPGFSVTRKGGTDGDPVLRGLGGSRLPILLDGMDFHGGCGQRMDPPTAYVVPETFDSVTVIKGPQTVAYGNGNSAGVVLFEHDRTAMQAEKSASASLMAGSWGRADGVATAKLVTDNLHLEGTLTHAESDDYKDGAGTKVHSSYERQSASFQAGFRPDASSYIGLDYITSKAGADYADRSMDGVKFDRDSYGLTFEKKNLSPLVGNLSARVYHSYIDHVMDNYTRRTKPAGNYTASNPDRETDGARAAIDLNLNTQTTLKLGADWRDDVHTLRYLNGVAMGAATMANPYDRYARQKDYDSTTTGVFGEMTYRFAQDHRLIGGLRHDKWEGNRFTINATSSTPMVSASRNLHAWFGRYEQEVSKAATTYIGLGHNERPMDYWEAAGKGGLSATSNLNPEKTTQLDAGLLWKSETMKGSISAYYAKVNDYMLVTWTSGADSGLPNGTVASKDATRYGTEADIAYKLSNALTFRGNLAYVHADNDTDSKPLGQTPPLDVKLGLDYKTGAWTFGGMARLVAKQDRFDLNKGNIVGGDLGATPGFGTLALNGSYKPKRGMLVSAGIDNLLDKAHAEHISRTGSPDVTGYTTTNTRTNEPGRFVWVKATLALD